MNIRSIRNFVIDAVKGVAPAGTVVYASSDVMKPDALQTRARVKVFPMETTKPGLGRAGLKEGAGRVQVDLYGPQVSGRDALEDLATSVVDAVPFQTYTLDDGTQLQVWSVWQEEVTEENSYFRIPVFIRWSLLHN